MVVRGARSVEGIKWLLIYCWMGWGRCLNMLGKDELKGILCINLAVFTIVRLVESYTVARLRRKPLNLSYR